MEAMIADPRTAVETYVHYENEENREFALSTQDRTHSYEIRKVEQLSDELWAITFFVSTDGCPKGMEVINFVGIIDGRYWVMRSIEEIPQGLKQNVENIEDYRTQVETIAPNELTE